MRGWLWVAVLACGCAGMGAQEFGDLSAKPAAGGTQYLTYAAEPQVVAAGKSAEMLVHLRVRDGFHVNSHRPASDLLIPTTVTLKADGPGVTVGAVAYPAGQKYSFASAPGEVLDVYAGDVVVRVPVTATKGEHTLVGSVRYQACDNRSCFPPKVVAVAVPFTAR